MKLLNFLPHEDALCRELIDELAIHDRDDRIKFRNNFKQKYWKHVALLANNRM